jgi:hypothetical protein
MDEARARGGSVGTVSKTSIVCGKNTSPIEGYGPGCGYLHGQIIAAHIDYSMNKNISADAAASINTSHVAVGTGAGRGLSEITAFDLSGYLTEGEGLEDDLIKGLDITNEETTNSEDRQESSTILLGQEDSQENSHENAKDSLSDSEAPTDRAGENDGRLVIESDKKSDSSEGTETDPHDGTSETQSGSSVDSNAENNVSNASGEQSEQNVENSGDADS